jgi:hypothetical protein
MIDMTTSDPKRLLTLKQAAGLMPRLRSNRPVTMATIWRWATYGLRGIRLETIQVGGVKCTTRVALQAFFEAVQAAREADAKWNGAAEPAVAKRARARGRKEKLAAR